MQRVGNHAPQSLWLARCQSSRYVAVSVDACLLCLCVMCVGVLCMCVYCLCIAACVYVLVCVIVCMCMPYLEGQCCAASNRNCTNCRYLPYFSSRMLLGISNWLAFPVGVPYRGLATAPLVYGLQDSKMSKLKVCSYTRLS